jgi:hypothetical protein
MREPCGASPSVDTDNDRQSSASDRSCSAFSSAHPAALAALVSILRVAQR